jgi:glycosyltransferase involved in cell wall biosynthesis
MKIALVVPGGVDRSGEYRVIPALLALLRRLAPRIELHVFALAHEPRAATWVLAGARVHNTGRPLTVLRTMASIRREHGRGRFALVHCIFSGWCGLVAALSARWLRLPYAVHLAGGELTAIESIRYGAFRRWHWRVLEPWILRGASAVSAASAPMIAAATSLGVAARRIPLGVDTEQWPVAATAARTGSDARLVHVASLNRVKDQATLLRALAQLARGGVEFSLDVIGVDTLRGEVQRLCGELGLAARIRFHGALRHAEARALVEGAHVHVMSSRHEAGPLALLEASISGVPSVGTAVGHFSEWAPEAAIAVPVGDADALAAGIRSLLDDEPRRLRMAGAAQRMALAIDADCTARLFMDMYRELAPGQLASPR